MARTKQVAKKLVKKEDDKVAAKASRRWRPGTVSLREIKKYQTRPGQDCKLLIPKAAFDRLIHETTREFETESSGPIRLTKTAKSALQHASEAFLTEMMAYAQDVAIHARHETVEPNDLRFAMWKTMTPPQSRDLRNCPVRWKRPRESNVAIHVHPKE